MVSSRLRNSSLVLICGFSSLGHRPSRVCKYRMLVHLDCQILTTLSNEGLAPQSLNMNMFAVWLRCSLILIELCENIPVSLSNLGCSVQHSTRCSVSKRYALPGQRVFNSWGWGNGQFLIAYSQVTLQFQTTFHLLDYDIFLPSFYPFMFIPHLRLFCFRGYRRRNYRKPDKQKLVHYNFHIEQDKVYNGPRDTS